MCAQNYHFDLIPFYVTYATCNILRATVLYKIPYDLRYIDLENLTLLIFAYPLI